MQPILIVSFVIFSFIAKGSSLSDTAGIHIQSYQELLIQSNNIDSLNSAFSDLYKKYETLNSALQFQEEQIRIMTEGNRNNQLDQIASRKMRIIATAEYINMVNDRLNNLEAFLTISSFQKDVTELNNANNTDLGFSLSTEINRLLEAKILKGKKKVNNIPKEKYLEIVSNVIKSPLTNIALSTLPVANSIRSVVDIVLNASLHGSDIKVEDIDGFKNDLSKYLHHYEGLSNANKEFSNAIASIQNRQGALNSLIVDFSKERVGILFPELKIDTIKSTDQFIKERYTPKVVLARVDLLTASNLSAQEVLRDPRFTYHYYSMHQARVIRDELELIMKEYIFAYNNYQRSINAVLINSMDAGIGDRSRIKKKMNELNLQASKVDKAIQSSINIKDLNDKLNTLMIM